MGGESIVKEIKSLNLPLEEYVVVGSAVLEVKQIRKSDDIDILTTEAGYRALKEQEGWNEGTAYSGEKELSKDRFSVTCSLEKMGYLRTPEQVIASAEVIDGVPFMNLRELMAFKMTLGREKDREDLKLIAEYISKNNE